VTIDREEDLRHLRRAVALAQDTMRSGAGRPFGAVLVRDGQVLAEAANISLQSRDPTDHAELLAIRRACVALGAESLAGATMYASGEPCPMCLGAMYATGVGRYVFASSGEDARRLGSRSVEVYAELKRERRDRSIASEHLPLPEAEALFDEWLERARRPS
jgi:tRNA(Arg) A34 adenosine deaminase TadA